MLEEADSYSKSQEIQFEVFISIWVLATLLTEDTQNSI